MASAPPIVITATRPSTFMGAPIGASSGGDTSGWDQSAYYEALNSFENITEPAKPTPCATVKPTEADINSINAHALAALNNIKANDGAHREILVMIWVDKNTGQVGKTLGQSSDQTNFVNADFDLLPPNVTIVAAMHSHVLQPEGPNSLPSQDDRAFFENMRDYYAAHPQGIDVSDNPLFYIWDASTDIASVYDRIKINGEIVQCALEAA